jgi:hypothetical protein
MATPDVRIKIAFDLAAAGRGDFFTIGDTAKGLWGPASSPLAGDILTDVTNDVQAVTWRRGRSRELDLYQAGDANVDLDNRSRYYDPTAGTAISPYAPSIVPRKELIIEVEGARQFSGQIEDWDLTFEPNGRSISTAKASDGFVFLSNNSINDHTTTQQTTGERINAILDRTEVGWPSARRNVDTGQATVQGDTIENNNSVLEYLNKVSAADPGALFIARDGLLTFRDRNSLQQVTDVSFTDDGTGIPFMNIGVEYGTEALRNQVTVTRLNGGTVVSENSTSQDAYGVVEYRISDSLLSSDTSAQNLADWVIGLYAEPTLRINSVTVDLSALTSEQLAEVLTLELGDAAQVVFTPNGVGDPIDRYVAVDQIQGNLTPGQQTITFGFSQAPAAFTLDSPSLGELDNDILGF